LIQVDQGIMISDELYTGFRMKAHTILLVFSMLVLMDAVVTLVVARTDSLIELLYRS
jgi:hypothetical protein